MTIEFCCPNCQAQYEVSNDLVGKAVMCRECGARSRVAADPEPSAEVVVRLADFAYQVVCFLVALGATGCMMLMVFGLVERRGVEAFVVVVLAGLQMMFAVVGAKFVLHMTKVFVGVAKDVGEVKEKLCKE